MHGGLLDKPGRPRDFFHTCYALSGLSVAQHFLDEKYILGPERNEVVSSLTQFVHMYLYGTKNYRTILIPEIIFISVC